MAIKLPTKREVDETSSVPLTVPLTVANRCDMKECGAQALVRVTLGFSPLDWCAHHYADVEKSLTAQGFTVDQDIRGEVR